MKKLVCAILIALMISGSTVIAFALDNSNTPHIPKYEYELKKIDRDISVLDATHDEATHDEATADEMYLLIGDCDMDGKVTVKDATGIQKYLVDNFDVIDLRRNYLAADADQNDDVNIKDATVIQKYCAGIDVPSIVGKNRKLDGKIRIFLDATWKPQYPLYCMCYIYTPDSMVYETTEWPGYEMVYNEDIGYYVVELPEYTETFLLNNYYHFSSYFWVPFEQDMVYYPTGLSDIF